MNKSNITPSLRMGLNNIKKLREELSLATSDLKALEVHERLSNMMSCVIHEMLALIGDRDGEGNISKEII